MNFESHLNPDERIIELEAKKKKVIQELQGLQEYNLEDIETQIAHKESEILDTKEDIYAYTQPMGDNKEEFDFDGLPKEVADIVQKLMEKKKKLIAEKRKLEDLLDLNLEEEVNVRLDELQKIDEELNK